MNTNPEPKYPLFYVSMKIMGKNAHSCMIDNGACPNIMPKIMMEQLDLTCTNEPKNLFTFNIKV